MNKYKAYWKGKVAKNIQGKPLVFNTKKEAESFIHLENQQMELAEYTPAQLRKNWKIKRA